MNRIAEAKEPAPAKRGGAGWLRSPQRVWLRRAIFQVHLWVGIVIAVYAVVIGLTGSALVFKEEMERAAWPAVYHIAAGAQRISLEKTVRQIETARPHWVAFALRDLSLQDQATVVLMRHVGFAATANYREVSFNPYTGEVLLDRLRYDGALGWMDNLHVYLLAGESGLKVSGVMALGLLVLCVTGLVLWWPGVQRWAAALVLNTKARWRRLNWDLHSVVGFWSCAALIVVTFTGLDFAFPDQVGNVVEIATGGSLALREAQTAPPARELVSSDAPVMTLDQAVDAVRRALPQNAPAGYLSLPANAHSPYRATGYYAGSLPYSELVRVSLDPHTGAVLSLGDTRRQTLGLRVEQSFTTVHFGSFGGFGVLGVVVKVVWVLLGVVPALLAVTGLLMYWNRKLRSLWLRLRRALAR